MSRYSTLSLVAAALLILASTSAHAADEPKDILAKAIKAHGGEEVLTKQKAAQVKSKGKIDLPGVGEVEFTQELAYMVPNKFRDSMEISIAGQTVSVLTLYNGEMISIEANGKAIDPPEGIKDAMKDVGHVLDVARLVTLKDKKYALSIIGEDKVEGKKVVGIRVSAKNQKDISVYFYTDSWLTAKLEYRTVDASTGNEITEERIITEYTKKDGKPVPKTILVKRDGKKFLEAEVLEITTAEKLDDSLFKK